ncbi:MAG TPA: AAA family ATPase, partial [Longimicrobiales bacterium]|nr:AAA family ATPase [Longimicrobiales bacterium]
SGGWDAADFWAEGGTEDQLDALLADAPTWAPLGARADGGAAAAEQPARRLAPPVSVSELLQMPEPEEEWLVEGLIPASGNVLLAGYPKTYKTMFLLELGVSLATTTSFLGRFRVPRYRRVGIVLMEDQAARARRRLRRICAAHGVDLKDLDGWLYLWFRPPLRLSDQTVVELGEYARDLDLDLLAVDSWAYVATGDSNSSDDVTPQLQALSACRVRRPGLTVQLTHHARKEKGESVDSLRLTDIVRNSSAFGAWYDSGLVLSRRDETSPVTVRAELRDFATPEAFAFTVEDEHPASDENGHRSDGWLRLRASEETPQTLDRRAAAEKLVPAVREFLAEHPAGVSRRGLREGVKGNNADVEAAFAILEQTSEAEHIPSPGKGQPSVYRPQNGDRAPPCPDRAQAQGENHRAHRAHTPVGGGPGQGSGAKARTDPAGKVDDTSPELPL